MLPTRHLLWSILFSLLFYNQFGKEILIIIASSVLIDTDHYYWYILNKKSFSIKNAYKFHRQQTNIENRLHIFHNIEFFIILIILSAFSKYILLITLGFGFHYLLDIIDFFVRIKSIEKVRTWSVILWIIRKWNT